jgi:phenylpropionate dioxygenase-like ring-hydroxylating dioxygenase large terminal subunit
MTHVLPPREQRIRRTLEHLRNATTDEYHTTVEVAPGEFTDPVLAAQERELVFGRVPSIVCHGSEISDPGDFLTVQMPRNNIIVARQADGSVKSFVNLCRHRGAQVEDKERGRCRIFSCPYHRWSYGLDGALRTVTRNTTFGDVDSNTHGLIELPTQERHGLVWIVDNARTEIDVAAWLGPEVDDIMAGYGIDALEAVHCAGFDEPVNWKVMQDAFIDNYHIQYAHPNTAGKQVHTNVQAVEDFGRHVRMLTPRKSIDRWLEEEPGDLSLTQHVIDGHFLLPNSTLLRQPDHFQLLTFRPHPTDPCQCRMEMRLLVPSVADSGLEPHRWQRRWDKNWEILNAVLREEDIPLLRNSQAALASADAGPLVLGRNEIVNHVFRREIRKLIAAGD